LLKNVEAYLLNIFEILPKFLTNQTLRGVLAPLHHQLLHHCSIHCIRNMGYVHAAHLINCCKNDYLSFTLILKHCFYSSFEMNDLL